MLFNFSDIFKIEKSEKRGENIFYFIIKSRRKFNEKIFKLKKRKKNKIKHVHEMVNLTRKKLYLV